MMLACVTLFDLALYGMIATCFPMIAQFYAFRTKTRYWGVIDGERAQRSMRDSGLSQTVSMLNISALNQYYDGSPTLHDVSLDVADGACTGDPLSGNNIKAPISV